MRPKSRCDLRGHDHGRQLLWLGLILWGCYAPEPATPKLRPIAPADSVIPTEREQVHQWASPTKSQCPDATIPAPGETPAAEVASNARVTASLKPEFRECFTAFVERHPFFNRGSVRLAVGVDCQGRVSSVRAAVSGVDRAMAACVMRAAVALRFPPPSAGIALVNVPATFHQ